MTREDLIKKYGEITEQRKAAYEVMAKHRDLSVHSSNVAQRIDNEIEYQRKMKDYYRLSGKGKMLIELIKEWDG